MSLATWKYLYLAPLTMLAFAIAALYKKDNTNILDNLVIFKQKQQIPTKNEVCNFFSGRWVYDNVSYPLYKEGKCSFLGDDFTCEKYGRENLKYQNWRWQPHHCDLPMFNGTAFLEKLRNKMLVFVGDSLNKNQWRSLLCLIEPYFPPLTDKKVVMRGNFLKKHVKEYNATIAFYWAPYLVESSCDKITSSNAKEPTLRFKSIEKHGRHWINADILIFDTFAWWTHTKLITILWGSFDNPNAIYNKLTMFMRPFEIGLSTWSDFLEFHFHKNKPQIFYMSASPYQLGTSYLGTSSSCYNATEPILDDTYWPNGVDRRIMEIVESTIEKLEKRGVKVEYLNITQLSGYREDARPSIYRHYWKAVEEDKDPIKYSDCLHWCLPGVPDVWNEILHAYIMKL